MANSGTGDEDELCDSLAIVRHVRDDRVITYLEENPELIQTFRNQLIAESTKNEPELKPILEKKLPSHPAECITMVRNRLQNSSLPQRWDEIYNLLFTQYIIVCARGNIRASHYQTYIAQTGVDLKMIKTMIATCNAVEMDEGIEASMRYVEDEQDQLLRLAQALERTRDEQEKIKLIVTTTSLGILMLSTNKFAEMVEKGRALSRILLLTTCITTVAAIVFYCKLSSLREKSADQTAAIDPTGPYLSNEQLINATIAEHSLNKR